ncbi:MAG UNVERIFIED_CONTAM: hypothetical protein LVT10_08810 [Anaerolineae bacterium]
MIEQFGEMTDVPVVLNTSFNLRGEPIVNTPREAWNTFRNSDIDILVLGNNVITEKLIIRKSRSTQNASLF